MLQIEQTRKDSSSALSSTLFLAEVPGCDVDDVGCATEATAWAETEQQDVN